MALGDAYALPDELAARLGRTDDGSFPRLLAAASRHVDAYCGRHFGRSSTATARRFRAIDYLRVQVDDFHTTSGLVVQIDGLTWDADYYEPRPFGGVVNGVPGWPYFDLLAVNRFWPVTRRESIQVTAQWGWAEVPDAIVEATLDVAESLAGGSAGGIVSREEVDHYSVSFARPGTGLTASTVVPGLLAKAEPYRRKRFGVA